MPSIQEPAPPLPDPPKEVTLRSIAGWQLDKEQQPDFAVELPKLQRGFVWEPAKVMDLWDSLLRGFPIGSMMISGVDADAELAESGVARYWLLDGQQRATSIAIGHYNPWAQQQAGPSMWSLKSVPLLWLDLLAEPREWDVKMFFSFLITQSHPWGYNRDGGVIPWKKRWEAREAFVLSDNYTGADLSQCFPWEAVFPVPLGILLEVANREGVNNERMFWSELGKILGDLDVPKPWKNRFGCQLNKSAPENLERAFTGLRRITKLHVHLNLLRREATENDVNTDDDNSLLFVRLNTGGVVLKGEELIFSLFKSAFEGAKDAVEKCSAGFMQPSKLFGMLVRLAAAGIEPAKLARPVTLREFKREIRGKSDLKDQLKELIDHRAERLMQAARDILCGSGEAVPGFCLPEAVATRTINASPDIFVALLYWLDKGGRVEPGSEEHRQLLGRFTALSWFLPGNAKAKQEALWAWVEAAGTDVAGRLWSGECLHFLFTRENLFVPAFPTPDLLEPFLLHGVLEVQPYNYENLAASNQNPALWESYDFLPAGQDVAGNPELRKQANLMAFLSHLRPRREMLLYAQRDFIRTHFKEFGQWELMLKDSNCPWDWDHIYPSAHSRHNVNHVYKDWHNSVGNLRAIGLSENRSDGCDWPTHKLADEIGQFNGKDDSTPSFITQPIWEEMQTIPHNHNAIKSDETALKMCAIVLKRLVTIYEEWHKELRIAHLMKDIRGA